MEDGVYHPGSSIHSAAPEGSSGKGFEYDNTNLDQNVVFATQDGETAIR